MAEAGRACRSGLASAVCSPIIRPARRMYAPHTRALGVPICDMPEAMRGSEDFGHYLKQISGALFLLVNGEEYPPSHAEQFDFPDDEIETAVEIFMAVLKGADIPVGEEKSL